MRAIPEIKASYFVPNTLQPGGDRAGYGQPQLELGLHFFNGLTVPLTVVTRTGVRFKIQPLRSMRSNTLVIRYLASNGSTVFVDTRGLLNDEGKPTSKEAQALDSVLQREEHLPGRWGMKTGCVDFFINQLEFQQNGGSLYLPNLDLVLSTADIEFAPKHPFSKEGLLSALVENDPMVKHRIGLSMQIKIVDRQGRFGSRFINLNGEVFQIPVEANTQFPDGVYLYGTFPCVGEVSFQSGRSEFYAFEDADKALHLYRTYNEALTLGNPADVYKREIEERQHALKREQADFLEAKAVRDREWSEQQRTYEIARETAKAELQSRDEVLRLKESEIAMQDQRYRIREADLKLREQELRRDQMLLKEVFDERAHNRREIVEILKHFPALITGGWAIFTAIRKLKG